MSTATAAGGSVILSSMAATIGGRPAHPLRQEVPSTRWGFAEEWLRECASMRFAGCDRPGG
jgi:hypothetical protein